MSVSTRYHALLLQISGCGNSDAGACDLCSSRSPATKIAEVHTMLAARGFSVTVRRESDVAGAADALATFSHLFLERQKNPNWEPEVLVVYTFSNAYITPRGIYVGDCGTGMLDIEQSCLANLDYAVPSRSHAFILLVDGNLDSHKPADAPTPLKVAAALEAEDSGPGNRAKGAHTNVLVCAHNGFDDDYKRAQPGTLYRVRCTSESGSFEPQREAVAELNNSKEMLRSALLVMDSVSLMAFSGPADTGAGKGARVAPQRELGPHSRPIHEVLTSPVLPGDKAAGFHALPVCDVPQSCEAIKDIGTLCAYLSASEHSDPVALDPSEPLTMLSTNPSSFEDWAESPLKVHRQHIAEDTVSGGLFSLEKIGVGDSMCVVSSGPRARTVEGGVLVMDKEARICFLIFDASCKDLTIKNTVIQGGTIVVTGQGSHVRFHNVHFLHSTLVVTDGAHVSLKHAAFTSNSTNERGLSLLAHGEGTIVHAEHLSVDGGICGIVAYGGAKASLEEYQCRNIELCGLDGRDQGTEIQLTRCRVAVDAVCRRIEEITDSLCSGIAIRGGCKVHLRSTSVISKGVGLIVEASHVEADSCRLLGHRSCSSLTLGTTADISKSLFEGGGERHGVYVHGAGTQADLYECVMKRNRKAGVAVRGGAMVKASSCSTLLNGAAGFTVGPGSELSLGECISEGDGVGIRAWGRGAEVSVAHTTVESCRKEGVWISEEAKARLRVCNVSLCYGSCVVVESGADAKLSWCALSRSERLHGLAVFGGDTEVEASGCLMQYNPHSGVAVMDGATVWMDMCKALGNLRNGCYAAGGSKLTMIHCVVHFSIGCHVAGEGTKAWLQFVKALSDGESASCSISYAIHDGAHAELEECVSDGARIHALVAKGAGTSVTVRGGRYTGSQKCGTYVLGGARVDIEGVFARANRECGFKCEGRSSRLAVLRSDVKDATRFVSVDDADLVVGDRIQSRQRRLGSS